MARETSVVTPERFQQGFSYSVYIEQIKVNKARFEEFYKFQVKSEDAAALKELVARPNGPAKMLVLGEDWCGDVIRGMPMLARVAEAAGLEMSIFPRDDHHDIMNEFLKNGEWMSIPVAVFYTKDHEYICHWIERPAAPRALTAPRAPAPGEHHDQYRTHAAVAAGCRAHRQQPHHRLHGLAETGKRPDLRRLPGPVALVGGRSGRLLQISLAVL